MVKAVSADQTSRQRKAREAQNKPAAQRKAQNKTRNARRKNNNQRFALVEAIGIEPTT